MGEAEAQWSCISPIVGRLASSRAMLSAKPCG